MIISVQINGEVYRIKPDEPLNISIPLNFNGSQPNAYGVEKASSAACQTGALIGDTRQGGSVNFEQITLIPHCNGTHTECVGHITHERISVNDCLNDAFIHAALISIEPENAFASNETYPVELNKTDQLITRKALEKALNKFNAPGPGLEVQNSIQSKIQNPKSKMDIKSLIIRTLPNDESKLTRAYGEEIPPFFSSEAMRFMVELGINHLLVDLPSIDRIFDEGKLSNHRIFWNVEPGKFELNEQSLIDNTITELIFVPDEIADGEYLLNLQIAPFASDASPSRPVLFRFLP